jgi:small subunit ribosomal protein S3
MGQKTHPKCFRLGITSQWDATWYADKKVYGSMVVEDLKVRGYLKKELGNAQLSRIEIRRHTGRMIVNCHVVRLGIAVGKNGSRREDMRNHIRLMVKTAEDVHLDFYEETRPDLAAEVVLSNIIAQLEKRINFRRAMKQAIKRTLQAGAQGVKVMCAGRLNGAEMGRTVWFRQGRIPLHTLRANIHYAHGDAHTVYGAIGVKVWIYRGDVVPIRAKQGVAV